MLATVPCTNTKTKKSRQGQLSLWLGKQRYKKLHDGEITKYAAMHWLANQVQIIVSLFALCVIFYAVFH